MTKLSNSFIKLKINIKPWLPLLNDLMEGNKRMGWEGREPHAYWKRNPNVPTTGQVLFNCNFSDKQEWGALEVAKNDKLRRIAKTKQGPVQKSIKNVTVNANISNEELEWVRSSAIEKLCKSLGCEFIQGMMLKEGVSAQVKVWKACLSL
ncbi:Uncharacterized protein TCM_040435 [Theobroma cacao]|uniref:Glycosyl transferase CAP10 domain-containing protein n=1 Tax=Theobroma cacao TaxID=3641 RepID=A0A061GST3_THECC|nr:Uncharacterized protein TCM_040435 [Theobroma cacao]